MCKEKTKTLLFLENVVMCGFFVVLCHHFAKYVQCVKTFGVPPNKHCGCVVCTQCFFLIEYTTFCVVGMAICVVGKEKGTLICSWREKRYTNFMHEKKKNYCPVDNYFPTSSR